MTEKRRDSRLIELIGDWSYLIRRDGFLAALPKVGLEFIQLPYRHIKYLVFFRSLHEPLPDIKSKIALEIRQFRSSDREFVSQMNRPSEANLCARRLSSGHKGFIAFHNGQLAGYAWGCGEINPRIERVRPKLDTGDVLCVDAFTSSDFRNKGVQTALTLARFNLFREQGFHRAVANIEIDNFPSQAVWKKLGSYVVGRLDFRRIGTLRKTWYL